MSTETTASQRPHGDIAAAAPPRLTVEQFDVGRTDGQGMNSALAFAKTYAERGLFVFPVKIDKAPCTPNGFYDATTDGVQLVEWFERDPEAGVAIRTGPESGVFVIDIDPRHGGDDSLAALEAEHGPVASSAVVLTGGNDGGRHYYFAWPAGVDEIKSSSARRLGPGIDVSATGHYVVAPASLHRSGRRYRWASGEIPTLFPPSPTWLLTILTAPEPQPALPPAPLVRGDRPGDRYNADGDVEGLLTRHEWVRTGVDRDGETYWRRPGKPQGGHSATLDATRTRKFFVFSTEASPFEADTAYSPFAVLAMLEHDGDFSAAAHAIAAEPNAAADTAGTTDDEHDRKSQATVLVELAERAYRIGRSDDGLLFGVEHGGPNLARSLRGGRHSMRAALASRYYREHKRAPSAQALADALQVLQGQAQDAAAEPLHLRAARAGDSIVIDLGDDTGRAVVIQPGSWDVVERSPVVFRRTELIGALQIPERGGTLDALRDFVPVSEDSLASLVAFLVAALLPDIPHAILGLFGQQGPERASPREHWRA